MNQKDFDNLGAEQDTEDQRAIEPDQSEETDPITELAQRLGAIESALGVGNSKPGQSNLLNRLSAIEEAIAKPQRERSLPESISREEAASRTFLLRHGIRLEDIASGKVTIRFD
jgi:hypothetical protein